MISDHQSWQTPLIVGDVLEHVLENEIIRPAYESLTENLMRSHFPQPYNLHPVEFEDQGRWPWRWKNGVRVMPFITKEEKDHIECNLNAEYEEPGLTQVVYRLKPDRKGPDFETHRRRVNEPDDKWFIIIDIRMTRFDLDDFEVGTSITKQYECPSQSRPVVDRPNDGGSTAEVRRIGVL